MLKEGDKKLLVKLGARLNELRTEKELSLRQLSYISNLDYSTIGKIEKGQVNITFTTLVELAKALEVELVEILNFRID
ncbi:DNA-binding transcriptional regulator, XRE family [Chitinophaga rupis]|uniref:DNA-binding transcriptional regulator, XRE family n=1 Tax=Chitinophaga rupis TaxID=573321 RepID=A0A1H8KJT4_9BACT|nr:MULTISPECIES: helix-turn-helix transcriptional regulator [Chitinophaga]SEN93219.1 DNA-binding transcriptional regulator, XRE family [Chitinophaga rupis]